MYFSSGHSIIRAEMDGRNRIPNFIRVNGPRGLVIDLEGSRLYLTSTVDKQVKSYNLEGGDILTIVQLGARSYPQGIALMADRIYWADYYAGKMERCRKNGTDL